MKNITYKVPKNDKEVFVDPAIDRIHETIRANRQKIQSYRFEINAIPFQVLRDKTRMELLHMAANYTRGIKSLLQRSESGSCLYLRNSGQNDSSWHRTQDKLSVRGLDLDYEAIKNIPIIQTGHEPIFYYPGVWIKNHLTQYLASMLGGVGIKKSNEGNEQF